MNPTTPTPPASMPEPTSSDLTSTEPLASSMPDQAAAPAPMPAASSPVVGFEPSVTTPSVAPTPAMHEPTIGVQPPVMPVSQPEPMTMNEPGASLNPSVNPSESESLPGTTPSTSLPSAGAAGTDVTTSPDNVSL